MTTTDSQEIIQQRAKESVLRGAQLLDASPLVPSYWRYFLNTSTLDLESGSDCVLGQIFHKKAPHNGYRYAMDHVFHVERQENNFLPRHGFASGYLPSENSDNGSDDDETIYLGVRVLKEAWTQYIQESLGNVSKLRRELVMRQYDLDLQIEQVEKKIATAQAELATLQAQRAEFDEFIPENS